MNHYKFPNKTTKAEAIIIANGEFPTHEIPLGIINNNQYIVCCDGGANQLSETNIIPNAIVGDCDSLSPENRIKYKNIIYPNNDQETNDLTKSIYFCLEKGVSDIIIVGATGKREDHTLANISLLAEHMEKITSLRMVTDYGVFTAIRNDSTFESFKGQQISIFSIEHTPISVQHLKYPIENRILNIWWEGTLNESVGDVFEIKTNGKTIIYQTFRK